MKKLGNRFMLLLAMTLMMTLLFACTDKAEDEEAVKAVEETVEEPVEEVVEEEPVEEVVEEEPVEEVVVEEVVAATSVFGADFEAVNLGTMISDVENWMTTEDGLVLENDYATYRSGNTLAGYTGRLFENELLTFKARLSFEADWTYFALRMKDDPTFPVWGALQGTYAVFIKNDGTATLEKWIDGAQIVLETIENATFLDEAFHMVEFGTMDVDGGVRIVVAADQEVLFDYVDTDNPIMGAGHFSAYPYGTNDLAIGGTEAGDYTEVEALAIENLVCRDDVPVAEGVVNMTASKDSWYGWHVDLTDNDNGWAFNPDAETGQYHGTFKDNIYGNVQLDVKFKTETMGEWLMFNLRHVTQDERSAAWGSSDFGPADNYGILLDKANNLQVMKWKLGSATPLITVEMDSSQVDMLDTSIIHELSATIENVEKGGKEGVKITIIIDGHNMASITDFENPFTNPGYFGVHGYGSSVMTLVEATATPIQ